MAAKTALQTNELFALSDALGMELFLHQSGEISGKMARSLNISEISLKMNMDVKIIWSKIEWVKGKKASIDPIIAIGIHVIGDLFLLAVNDRPKDEIRVSLIDGDKITRYSMETVAQAVRNTMIEHEKKAVKNLLKIFEGAIVAEFTRAQYDAEWAKAA